MGEQKKNKYLPVPVCIDMQKLVRDHCMPVDVDTELGMLVTIGIVVVVESPTLSLPFIETYTYLPYSCAKYPYISTQYFRSFKDTFHLSVLHQH